MISYYSSGLDPYATSDERIYTSRNTPREQPWGFMIGEDWYTIGDDFWLGEEFGDELNVYYVIDSSFGWSEDFGDDYGFGYEYGFGGWRFSLKGVGKFVSSAAKTAGRAVNTVGKVVKKIPIVGAPVTQVFSSTWNLATTPINTAVGIARGEKIDKAVLGRLKDNVKDVRTLASYAQVVASLVPGVGTGVSAALGGGMALLNGQPITDAVAAAVAGAVPGGPLARAALETGYSGVKSAVKGEKFNIEAAAKKGIGGLSSSLGLPPSATQAVLAGVTMTGNLARGVPPEAAIAKGAIEGLPVPNNVKAGMRQANELAQAVAKGKRIDKAALMAADKAFEVLPVSNELKKQVKEGIRTGKGILTAKNPNEVLAVGLQTGLADKLISSAKVPKQVQSALTTGMALGTGVGKQGQRAIEIANSTGKLIQGGVQEAKALPAVAEGRRLAGRGVKGFDLGHGVMQMHASIFDITAARQTLKTPEELKGFDMALAQHIGQVVTPATSKLSPAAQAGHAMAVGMQGYLPGRKAAMMKEITTNPSAAVGASVAVKQVAEQREGFIRRFLKAIGLIKK